MQWSLKNTVGNFDFYLTNWHWYNFPNICRTDVFEKIIPKSDCFPLQFLEGEMMKNMFFTSVMNAYAEGKTSKFGVNSHIFVFLRAKIWVSNVLKF